MNAYALHDRLEDMAWDRHYLRVAREEEEAELADWYDKSLKLCLFQSMVGRALSGKIEYPAAITRAFDDNGEFQEKIAEIARYMAETFAHNHLKIKYEE